MNKNLFEVGEKIRRRLVDRVRDTVIPRKQLCWGDTLEIQLNFKDDVVGTDVGRVRIIMKFDLPPYKPWWRFW